MPAVAPPARLPPPNPDPDAPCLDSIPVGEAARLVPPAGSVAHFATPGCDPNLWHVGPYAVAPRRPVAAGDELTLDYATHWGADGPAMACRCGSPAGTGVVVAKINFAPVFFIRDTRASRFFL